ncbi:hypothetical protein P3X46_014489 [Hevea brasiliensis]|uniref:Polymerase nucleotidyl transferase domain-containing protein n=1 Tax=Hevea brasiliensis TaxID=3981 RepID=A0ABQ9M8Z3_HEVBR|nr:uncharacterized protein LOC110668066 isoform X1 [Hevea brasiliensis]XP_021684795.2 uncharacterized protein LOC110668066 isoform X1 [Hevea brasiliensis]XP_021684797.2 uncharacterized protein LOC110668066 isoform X1 [Hevea brasiliensis]XP_021684798.2 uncharacterized protein LOC110668066 isoform X1 [Hevea brasiliensis]XP_058007900.1 uncharacterized protein LOC110668066 isoform X1 [Hevea brasiliensis]XP_058007901.1 uncharacterized protein LOC110668066 isoform X1 [Hevea brasiliensis]KAJ9175995.
MGDLQESLSPCSSSISSLDLYPLSIDPELWLMAEQRTQEILWIIQPAMASEQKRKEVIDYIQRLIKGYCATEVFSFGSVPLKTYLPDGDIDLTALIQQNMEEDLAREVCNILKYKEQDPNSEVKNVQYIQAKVKIVKCCVKDISVDISFNKLAGLCALCFLEQVDQLIGKDHLLKQSIILIKAWCFYESRILGAHHGLIGTYALEIMVLYIINIFHSSLPGPLAVLYRFLDYYSTFDWQNYCVSINGPVAISSLPEIAAKPRDNNGNELLINPEFLKNCRETFSIPIKAVENGGHEFPIKHLNILDPLKDGNNLGRSVNRGNFHRIKYALSHGAQRLGEILTLPGENMGARLEKFFVNTLDRNGRGERPDIQVPVPAFGTGRSEVSDLTGHYDNDYSGLLQGQWYHNYSMSVSPQISPPSSPSPSQVQQRSTRDILSQLLQYNQNAFFQRGINVFVPRVPLYHPYASYLYATTSGIDEMVKSRGTGTYIPDVSNHPCKDLLSWRRVRNPDSLTRSPVKLSRKAKEVEVENDPEADKSKNVCCLDLSLDEFKPQREKGENSSSMNLSLDQFPHLPYLKKSMSSEIGQSCQPIVKPLQARECFASLRSINFGTYRHSQSPLSLPSSMARKQVDSGVPNTLEIMPAIPKMGKLKQQESLETDKVQGQTTNTSPLRLRRKEFVDRRWRQQ